MRPLHCSKLPGGHYHVLGVPCPLACAWEGERPHEEARARSATINANDDGCFGIVWLTVLKTTIVNWD